MQITPSIPQGQPIIIPLMAQSFEFIDVRDVPNRSRSVADGTAIRVGINRLSILPRTRKRLNTIDHLANRRIPLSLIINNRIIWMIPPFLREIS